MHSDSYKLAIRQYPSPNSDERPNDIVIDTIVLHATVLETLDEVIRYFSNPTNKVSAHYTIDRDGSITAHVPELRRAWHAGQSKMRDGRTNVNDFSIGIELVNQNDGLDPFPEQQIAGMRALLRSIRCRHPIKHIIPHCACAEPRGENPTQ